MLRQVFVVVALLISASFATAQDTGPAGAASTLTLTCSDMEVADVLTKLSQDAKVTIIADGTVNGKLTMSLNGVTVEQALSTVGKIAKLEWAKVYTAPLSEGESIDAGKLFALMDVLKAFDGNPPVMWGGSDSDTYGLFVPPVKRAATEATSLAEQLGMKLVYLVRAERSAPAATAETTAVAPVQPLSVPPADARLAAQSLWAHFSQVPADQRGQVLRELGRLMYESLTPEQREQMRRSYDGRRTRGDGTEGNFRFERRTRAESESRTNQ